MPRIYPVIHKLEISKKIVDMNKDKDIEKTEIIEKVQKNQKEYNQQYYNDKKHIKSICTICGGKTSVFNKYQHEHTNKHLKKVKELENNKKLLFENGMKVIKIENLEDLIKLGILKVQT